MGEQSRLRFSANMLMVIITIGACTGYLLLLYLGHTERLRYQSRIHTLEQSQHALDRQLENNQYALKRAQDSLADVEENRALLEAQLNDLQLQNWQEKFGAMHNDYLQLQQKQMASEAETARLNRVITFLNQHNNMLQSELSATHDAKTTLENELIASEDAWKKKQSALDAEVQLQKRALADLNARLETTEPQQPPPRTVVVEKNEGRTKPETVPSAPAVSANNKNPEIYRHVRLQSAANAMQGKPSTTRKDILISVIPTVPGGISGDELLALITDMESADILILLKNTSQYLIQPLEDRTVSALVAGMNEQDANTARQLFAPQ